MNAPSQGGIKVSIPQLDSNATARRRLRSLRRFLKRPTLETLDERRLLSTAAFTLTQDWGSGFTGQIVVTNTTSAPISNWNLAFTFDKNFTSIWDGTVSSHSGNNYVIKGAGWNNTIAANGGTVEFGFVGASGNLGSDAPTGYKLNGVALSGSTPPALSVNSISVNDGTSGASANFTVTLSKASTTPVSVQYGTADGTARAGSDYTATSGTLTIPAGSTSGTIAVPVLPDTYARPNIAFSLNLSSPNGATLSTATATATIVDTVTTVAPPVANPDYASTTQNTPVVIYVLSNDTDAAGRTLSVASTTTPAHGTTAINNNGTVTYTPTSGYTGMDSFQYTASDGHGLTATTSVTITVNPVTTTPGAWPSHVYAPYVDMTLYPTYNLMSAVQNAGVKYFSLAFIVADPSNNAPSWGGYSTYDVNGGTFDQSIRTQIQTLRAAGGDVDVSFGGAAGTELAQAITTVPALTAAYQQVINAYGLTHIDFDIEGAAVADNASIDRRSQAIAALQQAAAASGSSLTVSFTLPVLPTGLTANGLYVLQSALKYGVKIGLVNGMAMDYGDYAAPNPAGQMGTYAIDVAQSLYSQLSTLYGTSLSSTQLWSMIGITPMIGVNDQSDEVFQLSDASQLEAFAQKNGLGRLAIWSLTRDKEDPAGALSYASATSSSIVQTPFAFSDIFQTFTS